jgi:hypothetical protein
VTIDLSKAVPTLLGGLLLAGIIGGIGLYAQSAAHGATLEQIQKTLDRLDNDVRTLTVVDHTHGQDTRMYLPDAEPED